MGDIHPDITPTGLSQADHVELMYMIGASLKGICAKLDADAGVTDVNYETLCYNAAYDWVIVENRKSERIGVITNDNLETTILSPTGIADRGLIWFLYGTLYGLTTLCAKLDADGGVTDTDHNALCYTAKILHHVINERGSSLGNGNTFYFGPTGLTPQKELVDLYYQIVDAIETLTEKLDAGGGVTDTDYEALWYTATITLKIQDSKGNLIGN